MPYAKTDIYEAFSELWGSGLGIGKYWLSYLKQEIELNTSTYTSAPSTTAQKELTQELEAYIQNSLNAKSAWLAVYGLLSDIVERKTMSSDLRIDEEILTIARLRQGTPLLIADLNWTAEEALEIRSRLATFEDDWNAPGMELYDEL